jgi:hypothetical protein
MIHRDLSKLSRGAAEGAEKSTKALREFMTFFVSFALLLFALRVLGGSARNSFSARA